LLNPRKLNNLSVKRFSNATPPKDRIQNFAELVESGNLPKDASLKDILKAVWSNEVITSQCPDLIIRLTSLRGEVSKRIWQNRGKNPDEIQILAVGTVAAPKHLDSYSHFLQRFYKSTSERMEENSKKASVDRNFQIGYDLLSKGSDDARASVLNAFNKYYNLPKNLLDKCIQNSAITCGGMRGLKDLADACVLGAKDAGATHRFIQPDNSFGTWWNIIERPVKNDAFRREIFTVAAKPENKLHITKEDVIEFYKKNAPTSHESWYITPVGNPSGTKMTSQQLVSTCKAIVDHNPKAVIILDSVYIRTLLASHAQELLSGLVAAPELFNNIMFLESFSKSHGLCRERLGMYFSTNEKLFTRLHTANIGFSAGPGLVKDFQFDTLGALNSKENEGVTSLHWFWQKERKGLYNFLMNDKNKHLFAETQPHVRKEDMDSPCTLYILLKTREGVKAQEIFVATGALGVDTPMLTGHYVRFAVGTLTKPTYTQYA